MLAGFEVDIEWKDGKLMDAVVWSLAGDPCCLRYRDRTKRVTIRKGDSFCWTGR